MAALGGTVATLADMAKAMDPNGKIARVIELLAQTNEMLTDMMFKEGNLPTGHRTTVRTGLPTVYWRLLNKGVPSSKSLKAQVDEQCGMLEARSEVNKDLAMLNGNTAEFRLSEGQAFIEAMNQEMQQTTIYGNAGVAPEEFTGLATRFSTISGATNGSHILDAGGTGSDNMSVWLVLWGDLTVHGLFPNGSQAGLIHQDLGEQSVVDATGIGAAKFQALCDRWQWKTGLCVKDWRYVVRICNIDVSNLVSGAAAADLIDLMIKAIHRIPSLRMGRPAFYMNRTAFEMLDIQSRNAVIAGGQLGYRDVYGQTALTFRGIPLRKVDQLLETEARVV